MNIDGSNDLTTNTANHKDDENNYEEDDENDDEVTILKKPSHTPKAIKTLKKIT